MQQCSICCSCGQGGLLTDFVELESCFGFMIKSAVFGTSLFVIWFPEVACSQFILSYALYVYLSYDLLKYILKMV